MFDLLNVIELRRSFIRVVNAVNRGVNKHLIHSKSVDIEVHFSSLNACV